MGFNNLDNHDDVVTHLGPAILEYEVKWALGSITMNKASRDDEIPAELFQILKNVKVCTQYASKFGKLNSSHGTGNSQFSFQSPKKAMPKNVQTITQFPSSYTLAK